MGCFRSFWAIWKWIVLISRLTINKHSDQRKYNYNSTAEQVIANTNLNGKIIIVTGGGGRIGSYAVKVLASRGATVIIADRDNSKNIQFMAENINVGFIPLNLGSLSSIDLFCAEFAKKYKKLNYLILTAGIFGSEKWSITENGIEKTFGVNHIGHHYLTMKLTQLLIKSAKNEKSQRKISRIISVSSNVFTKSVGSGDWKENFTKWLMNVTKVQNKTEYQRQSYYSFTKLCNILFPKEYNRQFGMKHNVYAVSVGPGIISTLWFLLTLTKFKIISTFGIIIQFVTQKLFLKTLSQATATIIRTIALTDKEFIEYGGSYFEDCNPVSDPLQSDIAQQKMLWKFSNDIIEEKRSTVINENKI